MLLILVALAGPTLAAKRMALLIGNQKYAAEVGRLKNPVNDVNLIAASLRQIGFAAGDIKIVKDAIRRDVLRAIDRHANALKDAGPDAIGFFYYSGHGAANKQDKRNYLIPVGVKRLDAEVWYEAVPLDRIVSTLSDRAANAAHFVVFDACRNLLNAPTRGGKGFVPVSARRGMLIAFSTDPGETASDEGEGSGPYATALAAEIVKPGLAHLDVFQNVKETVYRKTKVQVPWERNGLVRRVYLAGQKKPKPVGLTFSQQDELAQRQADITFWNTVKDTKDLAVLDTYIKQFPEGSFASLARVLADKLKKSAEKQTLALIKQEELRAAEERKRQAEIARLKAKRKAALARKEEELLKAHEEAEKARQALRLAAKERTEALKANRQAQHEKTAAEREATQAANAPVAALTKPSKSQTTVQNRSPAQSVETLIGPALTKRIQAELKRVGCLAGPIDGIWGKGSRQALTLFNQNKNTSFDIREPALAALNAVRRAKPGTCRTVAARTTNKEKRSRSRQNTGSQKNTATATKSKSSDGRSCLKWGECMKICIDGGRQGNCAQICGGQWGGTWYGRTLC